MGVSGLAVSPSILPFESAGCSWAVTGETAGSAKPPLLLSSTQFGTLSGCFCPAGVRQGVTRVGGSVVLSAVTTGLESSRLQRSVTGLSDIVSLLGAGQAASEGRFGIRSVPTDSCINIARPVT